MTDEARSVTPLCPVCLTPARAPGAAWRTRGQRGHGGDRGDGEVHIEGGSISGMETLCGHVDTMLPWESVPADTPVTCPACWEVYLLCRGVHLVRGSRRDG